MFGHSREADSAATGKVRSEAQPSPSCFSFCLVSFHEVLVAPAGLTNTAILLSQPSRELEMKSRLSITCPAYYFKKQNVTLFTYCMQAYTVQGRGQLVRRQFSPSMPGITFRSSSLVVGAIVISRPPPPPRLFSPLIKPGCCLCSNITPLGMEP